MRYLVPVPKQYVDESGVPYDGGTVSVYNGGTMTPAMIYENAEGDELRDNPAVLDSNGMWQAFVDAGTPLDYIVKDSGGNVVASYTGVAVSSGEGGGSGGGVSKAYVDANDDELRESVSALSNDINDERERATSAETAAKSVVVPGTGISVSEEVKDDGHSEFTVSGTGVKSVEISSPNDTVSVMKTKDASTGIEHFNIDVKNTEGHYINIASDTLSSGNATQTLDDDTRKYVPFADSDLTGLVGRNEITLQYSEDDVVNSIAVLDHSRKYLCTAQVKFTVNATTNDLVNIDVFTKVNAQKWLACSFAIDTSVENSTSKTLTWMVERSDFTCMQMALSDDNSGAEVEVEIKQLFIAEFSTITGISGGAGYSPGDAISLSNDVVNVLYGEGLELNGRNQLEVSSIIRNKLISLQSQINNHEVSSGAHPDIREALDVEAETRSNTDEELRELIEESAIEVDEGLDTESTNPVENRAVTAAMNGKQDQLTEMTDQEIDDLVNSLN